MQDAALQRRIDQALRIALSCCDPISELKGFSRPMEPFGLNALFSDFNSENYHDYLTSGYPWKYPDRPLISMSWGGVCGGSLAYSAIRLNNLTSIYFRHEDADGEVHSLIGSTTLSNACTADRTFIKALLRSNGTIFGGRVFGGLPVELSVETNKRSLPKLLYLAFEHAYTDNNDQIWIELGEALANNLHQNINWSKAISTPGGKMRLLRHYVDKVIT